MFDSRQIHGLFDDNVVGGGRLGHLVDEAFAIRVADQTIQDAQANTDKLKWFELHWIHVHDRRGGGG